nr:PfkB family carbohydrate kinase [Anaerolineae bacterium]
GGTLLDAHAVLDKFSRLRVLVVGDAILDEYVVGRADRLSREAPIPVLEVESRRDIPGGAANPAVNVAALGASCALFGVVGEDMASDRLRGALTAQGVESGGLVADPDRQTTVKTRIMARIGTALPQQVARLDLVARGALPSGATNRLIDAVARRARYADAILLSDYGTGSLSPDLIDGMRACASSPGALLSADAQGDFDKYAWFDLMKCNADEAAAYLGQRLATDDDFVAAARALCGRLSRDMGGFGRRGGSCPRATGRGRVRYGWRGRHRHCGRHAGSVRGRRPCDGGAHRQRRQWGGCATCRQLRAVAGRTAAGAGAMT